MRAIVLLLGLVLGLASSRAWAQRAFPTDEKGLAELTAREPRNGRAWINLGIVRQKAGKLDGAAEAYERAMGLGLVPIAAYNLATVHARRGDADKAFNALDQATKNGFARLDDVKSDPDLASLRAHPRWAAAYASMEKNVHPCTAEPKNRQLDFWVGEWDVLAPQGHQVGTSSVQRILGSCVIFENWTSRLGGQGKSFNFYDPGKKLWQQTYIDDKGNVLEITGKLVGKDMVYESPVLLGDGKKTLQRLTFTPLPDGRVRQLWLQSDDQGKTWSTLFDGFYRRKAQ